MFGRALRAATGLRVQRPFNVVGKRIGCVRHKETESQIRIAVIASRATYAKKNQPAICG